jgi:hypothetical protein
MANNSRPTTYVWKLKAPVSRTNWNANVVNAVTKVIEEYNGNILARKLGNFGSRFALAVVKAGHLLEDDIVGDQTGRVNPHRPISLTNGSYGKLGLSDPYGSQTLKKIYAKGGHFIDATLDSRDFAGVVTKGGKGVDIEPDYFYIIPPSSSNPNGEIGIIELKVGYGKKDKGQEAIQLRRAAVLFLKWANMFWPGAKPKIKLYFVGWSAQKISQVDFNEDPNLNPSAYPMDAVPIYVMTGRGCCNLLNINYQQAITELRKYAPGAKNYIFSTIKGLSRLYNNQKRALAGLPKGAIPRLPARNTTNIAHTIPSNLFMRRNLNKPANVPKNSAQSLLNRNLNASRSNHGVTNIRTGNNVANSFNILESKSASGKALGGIMKGLAENEALKAAAAERKKRKLGEIEELTTITTNTATLRRLRGLQAIIKRAAGELAKAKTNASKNRASKNLAEAQRAYNSLLLESRPAKVPAVLNKNAIVKSITNANDPVAAYGKFIREHTNLAPNIQKKFIELRNSSMTNANRNYYQTILNTK